MRARRPADRRFLTALLRAGFAEGTLLTGGVAAAIWLTVFISSVGVAYAAKDVVITTSGDRLIGEIKSVEKDVLTLSTDYSDADFKITWDTSASL